MIFTSTPFSDALFMPYAIGLLETTVATLDFIIFFFRGWRGWGLYRNSPKPWSQNTNMPISQDSLSGSFGAFTSVPPRQVSIDEPIFRSIHRAIFRSIQRVFIDELIMNSSTSLEAHSQHWTF